MPRGRPVGTRATLREWSVLTLGLTVHFPSSKLTSGGFPNLVDAIQIKNKKPSNMPFLAGCGPSYRFCLGHACPYPQINELRPSILAPGHRRTPPHASTTRKYHSARLEAAARFRACRARPHATGSRQRLHTHARDSKQAREHIQTEGVGERGAACLPAYSMRGVGSGLHSAQLLLPQR